MINLTDPNKKIDFEYVPMPAQVLSIKEVNGVSLNGDAKNLYIKMWKESFFYNEKYGFYAPTQADLAYSLGTSVSTIKRATKKLEESGLILVEDSMTGHGNHITVTDWRAIEVIVSRPTPKEARQEAIKQKSASVEVVEDTPVSVITQEPIILPMPVVEAEPMNEPAKVSESLSIPAKKEYTVELTNNQLEMYCNYTNQDLESVKQNLKAEPTVADFIIELLEGLVKEEQDKSFFSDLATKADPHFKGTTSHSYVDEDQFSPF